MKMMNYQVNVKSNRIISLKCHLRRQPAVIRLAYGYREAVLTVNQLSAGPELCEWRKLRTKASRSRQAARLHRLSASDYGCSSSRFLS